MSNPKPQPPPLDLAQFEGFTPGPWHLGDVLNLVGNDHPGAALIAAAPDLLASLRAERAECARLRSENAKRQADAAELACAGEAVLECDTRIGPYGMEIRDVEGRKARLRRAVEVWHKAALDARP